MSTMKEELKRVINSTIHDLTILAETPHFCYKYPRGFKFWKMRGSVPREYFIVGIKIYLYEYDLGKEVSPDIHYTARTIKGESTLDWKGDALPDHCFETKEELMAYVSKLNGE